MSALAKQAAKLGRELRVAYVGAGAIHFGGAEGPWDHATRVEALATSGVPVKVVGIADPNESARSNVLKTRGATVHGSMYSDCGLYGDYSAMLAESKPDIVFVGTPPFTRGTLTAPIELDCVKAGAHVFAEKPVAVAPLEEVLEYSDAITAAGEETGAMVSVGYMFRYNKLVNLAKKIIDEEADGKVMGVIAKYNAAYAAIDHPFWWDIKWSGGPVVEQATHFLDLARYFGGDVNLDTLSGVSIPATDPIGALKRIPGVVDESQIPVERRLPRMHSATWRFNSGAVGTLTHGLLLQGEAYDTAFEVWGDGLRIAFQDLYSETSRLSVRRGDSDADEIFENSGDDMYESEISDFFEAVVAKMIGSGATTAVRSSYADAVKSYQLSKVMTERCK